MTLLRHIVFVRNVFCFNGFNRFTWFNMGRITKDDRCLIMGLQTEKMGGQMPNKKSFQTRGGLCQSRLNNGVY